MSQGGSGGGTTTSYTVVVNDFATSPIEGAGVALDLSDGSRVEGTTGSDGQALIDYSTDLTVEQVTAHKDGHSFITVPTALLPPQQQMATVSLRPFDDTSSWVTLSGTATNMVDAVNDVLFVGTTIGPAVGEEGTNTYSLLVPDNTAFTLIASDIGPIELTTQDTSRTFHSMVVMQQPALTSNTTVDIDFNDGTAATGSFATSIAAPSDSALAASGGAFINVGSGTLAGGSTSCTANGAQFDCVGDYWDLGEAYQTTYVVADASFMSSDVGRAVAAFQAGTPGSGLVDLEFPNAPDVAVPSGAGPHSVKTTIEYSVAPGGPAYDVEVYNITSDAGLIGVGFGDGATMRVPDLPSTSDEAAHYPAEMVVNVVTCVSGPGGNCAKVGQQTWPATAP